MTIVAFPRSKVSRAVRINLASDLPNVVILPVVRIEKHPSAPPPKPGQRQSRRRVLEKLRQLQLEMGRSL
jgi:hypothetical protein